MFANIILQYWLRMFRKNTLATKVARLNAELGFIPRINRGGACTIAYSVNVNSEDKFP